MSYQKGQFRLNRKDGVTQYGLGGKLVRTPNIQLRQTEVSEPGTNTRALVLEPTIAEVLPTIDFTIAVQIFATYIEAYAMITAEGAVPAHDLMYDDGVEDGLLDDAVVDTCEVTVPSRGSVKAAIRAVFKDHDETQSYGTHASTTEKPMTKSALSTLTIGGTDWSVKWVNDIIFGARNNVLAEFLGTALLPSDVYARHAEYYGRIDVGISAASKFPTAEAGTVQDVVIALADNQATPHTTTFTFDDAVLSSERKEFPELGLELERIEWSCGDLDIT